MLKEIYDIFEDNKHGVFQVRCKSAVYTVEFDDQEKKQIFSDIIKLLSNGNNGHIDIQKELSGKYDHNKVIDVVNKVKDMNIIDEEDLRSSYGNNIREQINFFSQSSSEYVKISVKETQNKIENCRLSILGDTRLLEAFKFEAEMSGFKNIVTRHYCTIESVDDIKNFMDNCDMMIVDSDKWNAPLLDEINKIALDLNKPWILTLGVDGINASMGPLFIGRETGCYNCLINRLKSNMEFLPYFNEYENYLRQNKKTSVSGGAPIVMYDIIASIIILEIIKYVTGMGMPLIYKGYLTMDFFSYTVKVHPFLKVPGCPLCSKKDDYYPSPWLEPVTLGRRDKK